MNRFCAPARGPNVDRLPVQNPTKVEFVLNLRIAKALDLVLPANAVIE
jgi:hypothetical protein